MYVLIDNRYSIISLHHPKAPGRLIGFDWLSLAGKMAAEGGEEAMQCPRPFHIMVAVAKNGTIGNKGQLPWPRLR